MNGTISWLQRLLAGALAAFLAVPIAQAATDPLPSAPLPAAQTQSQSAPATPEGQNTQSQQNTQPLGTAAAPAIRPEGVAVSRPAGAAIAPAKQRRVRQWAIRIGLLVGAGIAIGTVAALSLGSPSHPH
ncbi:MAG TPA: hypothetical protein VMD25_14015 [Acidobacteriaceae bacterium]|nr:hypothetical protein [Acidobacteriaceae bacterium]